MLSVQRPTLLRIDSFLDLMSSSSIWTLCDLNGKFKEVTVLLLWVESPELALAVLKAEGSTPGHVSNLDALRRVQVVPGVLCVLLNGAGWVENCS